MVFQILVEREIKVENILTFLTKSKFKKAKKKIIFTKKKPQRTLLYTIEARYKQISGGGSKTYYVLKLIPF